MSSHENENKISHIIRTAQSVFAEYGYKKVTMDDVARKMNMARSGLYHYYKNKEVLFVAVLEYELMLYEKELETLIAQAGTPEEKLVAFGRAYMKFRRNFINMYTLTYNDVSINFDMINRIRVKILSFHADTIMKILKSDRTLAHIPNIHAVSHLLSKSIHGLVKNSADKNDNHLQNDVTYLCRIFYNGLCAKPLE
jgi:AcrR family transcriptional regulator